jgi:hypothetical protein
MAIGSLRVEVTASIAQLEKQLKAVEQKLAKTGKTIDDTLATPGAKMAVNMGKVFAVMGAIEFAAKSASAAVSLLDAFSAQAAGNAAEASRHFDAVSETIKQLPMGIGPVAAALEDLMHKALGVDEAMRKLVKAEERATSRELVMAQKDAIDSRMESLTAELEILNEADDEKRSILEHERNHNKLREDAKKLEEEIKAMDIDPRFKDTLLNKLAIEHGMQQDILNIKEKQRIAAIEASKAAEQEKEQNQKALKVQQDALRVDESRLGKIKQRLGLGAFGTMGEKSGFTQTGDTALGSFTFADQNVGSKIDVLQQEQRDIQRSIDNRTGVIQTLLEKLNAKMGFS